jgi:hypothetical protein
MAVKKLISLTLSLIENAGYEENFLPIRICGIIG